MTSPYVISASLVLALLAVPLIVARVYTSLSARRRRCHKGFYQIAKHWNRRYELMAQLTDRVGSCGQSADSEVLRDMIVARSRAAGNLACVVRDPGNGADLARWFAAECALTGAYTRLRDLMHGDAQLQDDAVFRDLMDELESTKNKIAFARQAYNDWVAQFNAHRRRFPLVTLASLLGFGRDLAPLANIEREQTHAAPVAALQG